MAKDAPKIAAWVDTNAVRPGDRILFKGGKIYASVSEMLADCRIERKESP